MNTENKIYITASELAESLGVSLGKSYSIIRQLNRELEKNGFITVAGKCPRAFFSEKWYGYETANKR